MATITVRDLDALDESWLRHESRKRGVSMEALVRHVIRERRQRSERHTVPAEAFKRHFGPEHGVELPSRARYRYRPAHFGRPPNVKP